MKKMRRSKQALSNEECIEILNKNKGSIDIKSEVGKGTEVVIRIPTKKIE